jgi:tRNA(Arg) A34 adenosine deaminase TadA
MARTVLKSPTWHAETIAATQAAPGGERVTFLDAYSFFLLLKTNLKAK